jgi:hypothetical protein
LVVAPSSINVGFLPRQLVRGKDEESKKRFSFYLSIHLSLGINRLQIALKKAIAILGQQIKAKRGTVKKNSKHRFNKKAKDQNLLFRPLLPSKKSEFWV